MGFIRKIAMNKKRLLMQSEIQEFMAVLSEYNVRKNHLKNFKLFEEFSGKNIIEIIEERRSNFNRFDPEAKRQVEKEIETFCSWLREVKGFHPATAHYYSVSLKSLLLGLPIGIAVGVLFGILLDLQAKNSTKEN